MIHSTYLQTMQATIDAKTIASTAIDTTETARRFYPLFATFEVVSASAVISVATLSIGTNATTYNNILAATAMTGLTSANAMMQSGTLLVVAGASIAPNTEIRVNVSVGYIATTANLKVLLHGFYD